MFRFKKFRRTLDAEMKDSTKCGVAQASKRAAKAEITEEEEAKLWDMKLLGSYSAESLLHTVYYFNGKLFGLRVGSVPAVPSWGLSWRERLGACSAFRV